MAACRRSLALCDAEILGRITGLADIEAGLMAALRRLDEGNPGFLAEIAGVRFECLIFADQAVLEFQVFGGPISVRISK